MPSVKSNLHISIEYNERKFTLNGHEFSRGQFVLKKGRSKSKIPFSTTTEIFDLCRRFVSNG